jgi:hypothetical protein
MVCGVTRRFDIPRDWQHIVGHGQLQPQNRTDPGPHWPWARYLHRVQADCGEVVVDDDDAFNDTSATRATIPATWSWSDATADYYGGGYRWAVTSMQASDAAELSFRVDTAGLRTVEVRWTSGANRSPQASYAVVAATGDTLGIVTLDQTVNGGKWRGLGTWTFPAGWSKVALLRRAPDGAVVVADAVRVRE